MRDWLSAAFAGTLAAPLREAAGAGPTRIADLPPEQQQKALAAFVATANAQRHGDPEILATSIPANPGLFHAMGLFTHMAEHVGDLTHRMAQKRAERMTYGFEMVREKVRRALGYLRNGYGFAHEVEDNLRNNHAYRVENGAFAGDLAAFKAAFAEGAKRYADAHAAIPVWNEAQWHAREAAVALGQQRHAAVLHHLEALERHLGDEAAWAGYASQVRMDAAGEPVPFTR